MSYSRLAQSMLGEVGGGGEFEEAMNSVGSDDCSFWGASQLVLLFWCVNIRIRENKKRDIICCCVA